MSANTSFHIITLGCRTNQYESQSLRESLLARGFTEADDPAGAGLILVNSCAVTAKAVRDTNQEARRAARAAPKARIVITGCAAQVLADKLRKSNPGAEIVPQSRKSGLARWPDAAAENPGYPDYRISTFPRARAVVKVQDGCSHGCAFCIVPRTRGRSVSRDPGQVVTEIRRLFAAGFAEVSLSGVNLGHYGRELTPCLDFWDLIALIERELSSQWTGRARIRLSSLDPGLLGPKALDALGHSRLLCPHLHLSLQSLSPDVLAAMGRGHYSPGAIKSFIEELSGVWPVFGLGADLLAGFPGESDEDFELTLTACRELPLTYAHVFPFSRRPGTRAAGMPGQVAGDTAKERAAALRKTARGKRSAFLARLSGLDRVHVVLESLSPAAGICEFYARCVMDPPPENAVRGGLMAARPVAADKDRLKVAPTGANRPEDSTEDRS